MKKNARELDPLVSVVVPVYNAEKYLDEALESLVKQKYKNIEIICVDDGSTDDSVSVIEKFIQKDKRIKLEKQENLHAGIARNTGMKIAHGEYILFLDSDDIFERDMISCLVKTMQKHESDMIVFNYYTFSGNILFRKKQHMQFAEEMKNQADLTNDIFHMTIGAPWNKFYKMDFVKKTGIQFQDTLNSNDIYFTRITSVLASKIFFLDKRLVNYRINNKNSLQGNVNKSTGAFAVAFLAIYDKLENLGVLNIYRDAATRYAIDLCVTAFEKIRSENDFHVAYNACKDIVNRIDLKQNNKYLLDKGFGDVFEGLLQNNESTTAIQLCLFEKKISVNCNCIEYRIGRKMLSMFGIKSY